MPREPLDFILPGNDDMAKVFSSEGIVRRIYNSNNSQKGKLIYDFVSRIGTKELGLVDTTLTSFDDHLELEHEQITFAKPGNWTTSQLFDASVFTLHLNSDLLAHHLALKDMLPENVLFKGAQPVFIDFSSIVFLEDLTELDWLKVARGKQSPQIFIIKKMFIRFMLIPLQVGIVNSPQRMKSILETRFCNSGAVPPRLRDIKLQEIKSFNDLHIHFNFCLMLFRLTFVKDPASMQSIITKYLIWLERKRLFLPSSYSSYYTVKGEEFDFTSQANWGAKQTSFWTIINQFKPTNLIDIGANTGWFSILASSLGIKVTSVEMDEPSLDMLYRHAKSANLSITCLLASFQEIATSKESSDTSTGTHLKFPQTRFDHDGVVAFGLVHHLCLGQGIPVSRIMATLSSISKDFLVLEYVDLLDEKIETEKSFFPQYEAMKSSYSKEEFINFGKVHFKHFAELPSHPESRTLLVFSQNLKLEEF